MTTPLPSARIDDLLSELQLLETRTCEITAVPTPIFVTAPPMAPPVVAPIIPKKEVAPVVQRKQNPFVLASVCSLLFFTVGLFSSDFFVTATTEEPPPTAVNTIAEQLDPQMASLQSSLQQMATTRHTNLLSAIDRGVPDLNNLVADNNRLTSLALLKEWHALKNPSLRGQFIELASASGLSTLLPAQVTHEEKLRPLYYLSDSPLHIKLTPLHKKILHDIP